MELSSGQCHVLGHDTLPLQCLFPPKSVQCKYSVNGTGSFVRGNLTIAGGHLRWTSIPSKGRSNTPRHFMLQKLEWRTRTDGPSGLSVPLGMELAFVPCSQGKHHWNIPILSHKDWKGDLVFCLKQTFHHLSPTSFAAYTTKLLSEGGKGHLLTCTFSKQLCGR